MNIEQEILNFKILKGNGYKPQPYQEEWHGFKTPFLVAVCGRQIGKTCAAVNEIIERAWLNPCTRNWYVTNDYQQAKRNVWDEFKKWIPKEMRPIYNEAELKITFPNTSKIELIGVENAERLRGAVVHFMVLDEYADFPRDVFNRVLMPMFSTTEVKVWFMGTPKGLGNDFHDRYFDPSEVYTKSLIPACTLKDGKIVDVTSRYGNLETIQKSLETLPDNDFRQEYLGDFTKPSGTVYSEWPEENFVKLEYDPTLPVHATFDFGVNDPTVAVIIQPHGGEYRVIDYLEVTDSNIETVLQWINSKPYTIEFFTGDHAGRARSIGTGTSPIDMMEDKGFAFRTTSGLKIPGQIRVTHGIIKGLYVSDKLVRFRDCLMNYAYPKTKEGVVNETNEIPIHNEWSHAMRALEYYAVNVKGIQRKPQNKRRFIPGNPITGYGGRWI
jgi:hypothetical protein